MNHIGTMLRQDSTSRIPTRYTARIVISLLYTVERLQRMERIVLTDIDFNSRAPRQRMSALGQ
jgi:hypothetical protein